MIWRLIAAVFAALFVFAAAVQYNDPDPLLWIWIYLWPAALCASFAFAAPGVGHFRPALFGACLLTATAYGVLALLTFPGWLPEWFADEEVREAGGLLIAAATCAMLAWRLRKQAAN